VQARPPQRPTARVVAALRERIAAGEWSSGDQLPSVAQLAREYGVSSRTIAKVYGQLADEGLVIVTPSWGTHLV
jgi:DNA-binding GntR family transcriptional regulator